PPPCRDCSIRREKNRQTFSVPSGQPQIGWVWSALRWITGPFGLFGVNDGGFEFAVCRCRKPVGQISLGTFHPSRRPIRESATRLLGALGMSSLPRSESPEPEDRRIR